MATLTPSSAVGSLPPTKSASLHGRVVVDRLLPKIDTHVPGVIALVKLAALTTPFPKIAGSATGACTISVTGIVCAAVVRNARCSVIVPLYVPGARSLESTSTLSVAGVAAPAGLTESHFPFGGAF